MPERTGVRKGLAAWRCETAGCFVKAGSLRKTFKEKSSLWLKIVGWACIFVGLLGIVLPIIPGIPFLIAGVATLSTQYRWARAVSAKLKTRFRGVFRKRGRGLK